MKIAVLGDVHANLTAFEAAAEHAARWQPDAVVSVGDIVNRGPSSPECLAFAEARAREDGWRMLRGNHEDYIIGQSRPDAVRTGREKDPFYLAYWTYRQLGEDVTAISRWSELEELAAPDGSLARIAHASVKGNAQGIFPQSPDEELLEKGGRPSPGVFCGGHTHTAFVRRVDGTLFVNSGSVGIPFDGDRRAAYARLTWQAGAWGAKIVRLDYDMEKTLAEYAASGFLQEAGPIAWLVLAEFLYARSQLFGWQRTYLEAVNRDEITIEWSVIDQLERQGLWDVIRPRLG